MNKKLLALAVAGCLAAPMAANADVTISGFLHMSIDATDNGSNSPLSPSNHTSVSSNWSTLTFSGSEDLGNGMSALWQVSNWVILDEGGSSFATSDSFVGLAGSYGTVQVGLQTTPYWTFQNNFDVFDATLADLGTTMGNVSVAGNDYATSMGGTGGNALLGFQLITYNTIAYISPEMNGLQVMAAYSTDAGNNGGSAEDNNNYDAVSANVTYTNGGLMVGAAYERHNYGGTFYTGTGYTTALHPKSDDAISLGATYSMNATSMGLLYEVIQGNPWMDRDGWTAYLTQGFGNNTAKALYSTVSNSNTSATKDGSSMWAVGLYHDLSKRTSIYGMYASLANDAQSMRALGGVDHGDILANAGGQDQTGFSLGITHSF